MTEPSDQHRLSRIEADIATIRSRMESDFRALYGNGHPGLIDRHADLEKRLEAHLAAGTGAAAIIQYLIAAVTILCARYTAFAK